MWSIIFFLFFIPGEVTGEQHQQHQQQDEEYDSQTLEPLPYFDRNATIISNMTVQMGTDVSLSCRVNRLGDKVVSGTSSLSLFDHS